ncbi:hypothetical protein BV22DRAFT_1076964 [Leucogyrophana mollusca]|uniref:Uncharacterized protein n=1 Tax=Leucogyrophana mollusca TaxID=85980 RepID=A0ACB8BZM5_9AGAM|nr:hypothetical protein BV22DRAFT_1076964 [Leucogyrophana mollusca]
MTMAKRSMAAGSVSSVSRLLLALSLSLSAVAQPATLPFHDCFSGNDVRKLTVDTVYAQIINYQTLNITVLGQSAQLINETNGNSLATLFVEATTLTFNTFTNNSGLCLYIRPPSPLPTLAAGATNYCPLPAGPFALNASIPFNTKNSLTTMNTELRAVDPESNEILCLQISTTPLHPGPLNSPYGRARIIFWATIGLAIAYWLIVGIARVVSAWGRGISRPGPGIWHRFESAGFILASAISGERLATSPALMRFCSPSLRDVVFHTQWCAALSMVAVQWPNFIYPLLSQASWATLTYNITLTPSAPHWNPLDSQPYSPPSNFADQLADPTSPIYIDPTAPNTLFSLPSGTPAGIESFAWSVGVRPTELFAICLALFLAILAGTIVLSLLIWLVDWACSRSPASPLPAATKSRLSGGSKDILDASADDHLYTPRRRWMRPDVSSFHTSVLAGNLVRVLILFHLPVTIFSSYELTIAGASRSSMALAGISFVLFSVLFPALLVIRLARTPTAKLYDETRTLLALGPLYNQYRPQSQLFSSLLFVSNLTLGIAIGAGQKSGTAQAIVILIVEVISALVTSIWLPWGAGAGMGLASFLGCVARIVVAVLVVILTPTISIGAGAGGWVAYGILIVLCLVYLAFFLMLLIKVVEAFVRIIGPVGFDKSRRPVDTGLVGACGLLSRKRNGRERRRYRATEVHHPSASHLSVNRDSFSGATTNARDSSSYAPPNASFAQHKKGSGSSNHSGPPSVLRPEHALRPYREDMDSDDEGGYIMGAWQPFPGPGVRPKYERADSRPSVESNPPTPPAPTSGFSRVGGGRAHFDSPYAIAGGVTGGAGSTLTFPSVERKVTAGSVPRFEEEEVQTPTASMANVARLPALAHSSLPPGAMMPHMRTKSQTAVIVDDTRAEGSRPVFLRDQGGRTQSGGTERKSDGGDGQPKKKYWFDFRRNRRHSEGDVLEGQDATGDGGAGAEDASTPEKKDTGKGKSFVVIRDRKPQGSPASQADQEPTQVGAEAGPSSPTPKERRKSFVVLRGPGS